MYSLGEKNMSKEAWITFMKTGTLEELELMFGKKLAKRILRIQHG